MTLRNMHHAEVLHAQVVRLALARAHHVHSGAQHVAQPWQCQMMRWL